MMELKDLEVKKIRHVCVSDKEGDMEYTQYSLEGKDRLKLTIRSDDPLDLEKGAKVSLGFKNPQTKLKMPK